LEEGGRQEALNTLLFRRPQGLHLCGFFIGLMREKNFERRGREDDAEVAEKKVLILNFFSVPSAKFLRPLRSKSGLSFFE
jgi:hypothetical protein